MVKRFLLTGLCSLIFMGTVAQTTAFAGEWRTGAAPNEGRWWYANEDGTYAENGWYWLDGNQDSIEECYYFDSQGWMLSDTMTPDGYTVNADGAWTQNQRVQVRNANYNKPDETKAEENNMIQVTIQVGEREFEADLLTNASVESLVAHFPLTVTMGEMNGNEKYYYLPTALPADAQSIGTIHAGDFMLFGSDCLVLFYEDFRTSYRYTRLGHISNPAGLADAMGEGSVSVTFRLR